jgi:hypothetical protein
MIVRELLQRNSGLAQYSDALSEHKRIDFCQLGVLILIMDHAPVAVGIWSEGKFLVVVLFTLVLAEVGAVEVEQAVGEFVACQGPEDECRLELVVEV